MSRTSSFRRLFVAGLLLCGFPLGLTAGDWPQYRGPRRDDVSDETGLLKTWPAEGPKLLWSTDVLGLGYSGPAIVGDRLFTLGDRGEQEFVIALDLAKIVDGKPAEAWATEIGNKFDFRGNNWSAGPSATPTIDGARGYALSGNGDLACFDIATGKLVWRKVLPVELGASVNPIGGGPKGLGWGFTWSPLVDGDQLVCVPGGNKGTVAALHKQTGDVLWQSRDLTDQAAYTSAMLAVIEGVRQYIVLTNQSLAGIDAKDGRLLWRHPQRLTTEVINSPVIQGNLVYVTVGAGSGSELVKITRTGEQFQATSVYTSKNMANHHANVVLHKGHIFGSSQGRGFVCQAFETGELAWFERSKIPTGAITFADGMFYSFAENDGTVTLLEANTSASNVVSRFRLPALSKQKKPQGRIWTPPVISGGRLFLRDQELLYCYDVKDAK